MATWTPTLLGFNVGSGNLSGPCVGADGNFWSSSNAGAYIFKCTPGGVITTYVPPVTIGDGLGTLHTDNKVYFNGGGIYLCIDTSGTITNFAASGRGGRGVIGPDGNWWTTASLSSVAKITTGHVVTTYSLTTTNSGGGWCSDGVRYVYEVGGGSGTNNVATKIDTTGTVGANTHYDANYTQYGCCFGTDGNIWMAPQTPSNGLIKMTPTGVYTQYLSGSSTTYPAYQYITLGLDGFMYAGGGVGGTAQLSQISVTPSVVSSSPTSPFTFPSLGVAPLSSTVMGATDGGFRFILYTKTVTAANNPIVMLL